MMRSGQLIVPSKTNSLYNPTFPNDWLNMLPRKFDFKRITLHGFRHTHCSLLFEMGTPLKEVQDRLGHTDIKTTMNIYTHSHRKTERKDRRTVRKIRKFLKR